MTEGENRIPVSYKLHTGVFVRGHLLMFPLVNEGRRNLAPVDVVRATRAACEIERGGRHGTCLADGRLCKGCPSQKYGEVRRGIAEMKK